MKKLIVGFAIFALVFPSLTLADEYVNGYYRSNGTYVNGYYRSTPDGDPYNNFSYPGNTNPYTGEVAPGDPETYLENYYNSDSGTGSTYTVPTTPICGVDAYYNGSACACDSGYVSSDGTCKSEDSLCYNQVGIMSSYDSVSGNCQCDYGYVLNSSGQCTYGNSVCSEKYGMATYNTSTKNCECMTGYSFNGSTCVSEGSTESASVSSAFSASNDSSQSKLTTAQINSILGLLEAFGADATTIAAVQAAL